MNVHFKGKREWKEMATPETDWLPGRRGAPRTLAEGAQVILVSSFSQEIPAWPWETLSSKQGHFHETYLHCKNI